jgi:hypothetical protein
MDRGEWISMSVHEEPSEEVVQQIRSECEKLGADEEMIGLVLASLRHDPKTLKTRLAHGGDLRGYVRLKMAHWTAIFEED